MKHAVASLIAAALMAGPSSVLACDCVGYSSAAEQAASAELLVRGVVVSTRKVDRHRYGAAITQFRIVEVLKGDKTLKTLRVRHETFEPSCGLTYKVGEAVMVMARLRQKRWTTSWCSVPMFPEDEYRRALAAKSTIHKPGTPGRR